MGPRPIIGTRLVRLSHTARIPGVARRNHELVEIRGLLFVLEGG